MVVSSSLGVDLPEDCVWRLRLTSFDVFFMELRGPSCLCFASACDLLDDCFVLMYVNLCDILCFDGQTKQPYHSFLKASLMLISWYDPIPSQQVCL